ncbi:phosphoribosylglycinamide formyltransferase [Maridesulfovibrio bastinii]|uniref:phosphoribosylglycinamide formyltransferase n=1 Tax=Maridesulfovibrio bastinii TaxID=47157 RepID=UPI00041E91E1|nr:phosphoribosylglycinamide formyltransferase [Maridesulfovibrio bastinii]
MALPIGVLISGSGSNLQSLIDKIAEGSLDASIKLVVSNKADAYGLERAAKAGIATRVLKHGDYSRREEFDAEMVDALKAAGVKVVVMAGFMRIITSVLLKAFPERVINIHPALLPSFPGVDAQGQACTHGVKIAGCSVHFVDEGMDSGAVIQQAAVPVFSGEDRDALQKRILKMEHRILPQVVQWLSQDRLSISGRQVILKKATVDQIHPDNCLINPPLEAGF